MEALLVLIVIVLSIVLIVLAVKYNSKKEELHKLTANMQDLAHKQYQAWVDSDSQNRFRPYFGDSCKRNIMCSTCPPRRGGRALAASGC